MAHLSLPLSFLRRALGCGMLPPARLPVHRGKLRRTLRVRVASVNQIAQSVRLSAAHPCIRSGPADRSSVPPRSPSRLQRLVCCGGLPCLFLLVLRSLAHRECDAQTNTLKCGWDGGDCCEETCLCSFTRCLSSCGANGYNCIRPTDVDVDDATCDDCCEEGEGIAGYESFEIKCVPR